MNGPTQKKVDMSATVAGNALTELHEKITADEPSAPASNAIDIVAGIVCQDNNADDNMPHRIVQALSEAGLLGAAHEPGAELAEIAEILVRYADWFYTHDHEPRGRELSKLADKLRAAQPPAPEPGVCQHGTRFPHECRECIDEDVIRTRAFWSLDRKDLVTAYVSDKDITLMNDNGHIWEAAGDEQRHGPSPTKPAEHVCGLRGFGAPSDVCPACSSEGERDE